MVELVLGHGRHAQGRARHRPDHGAVRAPAVRRRALRGDARDQAAVRPARACSTRASCSPTTRDAHLRHLKPAPDGRAGGRPLRRVRLLRAGLPEPGPHDRPRASASCCAARCAGPRAAGDAALVAELEARVRLRRPSTPAPSTACARPPARSSSTPATWSSDCARSGAGRAASAAWDGRREALGRRHARGARLALTVAERAAPPLVAGATAAGPRGARPDDVLPRGRRDLPARRVARRPVPAPRPPDAVYFPACIGTMFGPADDGAGVHGRVPARCASARASRLPVPDGIAVLCCGTPWKSKGMRRRLRGHDEPGAARRCGRPPRRAAAGGLRRVVLHRGLRHVLRDGGRALLQDPGGRRRRVRRRARCCPA